MFLVSRCFGLALLLAGAVESQWLGCQVGQYPELSQLLHSMLEPQNLMAPMFFFFNLPSLRLAAILHLKMDGWNTMSRFLSGVSAYFQGRLLLVSGRCIRLSFVPYILSIICVRRKQTQSWESHVMPHLYDEMTIPSLKVSLWWQPTFRCERCGRTRFFSDLPVSENLGGVTMFRPLCDLRTNSSHRWTLGLGDDGSHVFLHAFFVFRCMPY